MAGTALEAPPGRLGAGPVAGMRWVPGGTCRIGSDDFYPEERPVREVTIDGYWLDQHPVTVAQYRRFVRATGYQSIAERPPDPHDYPDADPALLVPGALVFHPTPGPVDLTDYHHWWHYQPGASWKHPAGPGSSIRGREKHPVVQIAYPDAEAYATWAGKVLPSEAEWELAARGGLSGATFAWGNEETPGGRRMANTWQGEFPWQNLREDGYEGTSPVGTFPPNGYGLYDMTGNVWEWTADWYRDRPAATAPCCGLVNPRVSAPEGSYAEGEPGEQIPRRVVKGGSHLCAPNYCFRYRPAARQPQMIDTSMAHLGFRCAVREVRTTGGGEHG